MRWIAKSGKDWDAADRLGFLWMSTVAVKLHAGEHNLGPLDIHRKFDEVLVSERKNCAPFEEEAREIGEMLASHGLSVMSDALDQVEGLLGLNAGEWVSRRWDGITAQGFVWCP